MDVKRVIIMESDIFVARRLMDIFNEIYDHKEGNEGTQVLFANPNTISLDKDVPFGNIDYGSQIDDGKVREGWIRLFNVDSSTILVIGESLTKRDKKCLHTKYEYIPTSTSIFYTEFHKKRDCVILITHYAGICVIGYPKEAVFDYNYKFIEYQDGFDECKRQIEELTNGLRFVV